MKNLLIIGIGNEGREDDGLGWRFLEAIENTLRPGVEVEYRYQLQVEDAELVSHYRRVLFVDADTATHEKGFRLERVRPRAANSYTSHRIEPAAVLDLARTLYAKSPDCYLLGISGESFNLAVGLTATARGNLRKTLAALRRGDLENLFRPYAEAFDETVELDNRYLF